MNHKFKQILTPCFKINYSKYSTTNETKASSRNDDCYYSLIKEEILSIRGY